MILTTPQIVVVNSAGEPYGLARMYIYRAGTLTALASYTDQSYGTPHSQPVEADANGVFPPIYINPALGFDVRIIVKDSTDTAIPGWDIDAIPRADNSFPASVFNGDIEVNGEIAANDDVTLTDALLEIASAEPRILLRETDRGTDLKLWDIDIGAGVLSIRTRTDADGAGKDAIVITRGSTTAISSIAIGNATDVPTVTVNGTTLVAANVAQVSTGSFTGTLTGMSASTTGTVSYVKVGRLITLYVASGITGTSNAATMTMTGIPDAAIPAPVAMTVPCYNVSDDGGAIAAYVSLATSTFTFAPLDGDTVPGFVTGDPSAFTASGVKGLLTGWTITYPTAA